MSYHVRVTSRPIYGDVKGKWTMILMENVDMHYVVDAPSANVARKCAYMYEKGDDMAHTPMKEALKNTELVKEVRPEEVSGIQYLGESKPNGLLFK